MNIYMFDISIIIPCQNSYESNIYITLKEKKDYLFKNICETLFFVAKL